MLPGLSTQPTFQGCEGARDAQPSLRDDDHDGAQVRESEPDVIDTSPPPEITDDDEHKASNDERDKCEVQCQHDVREKLIRQIVAH